MSAYYSIKDMEALSGIKAHTIRIWEQRYGILRAERTATNIRVYNDEELKQLMSIALLNKKGIKISKLAKLQEEDLYKMVQQLSENLGEYEDQIQQLFLGTIAYDENKIIEVLNTNISELGFEETIKKIIFPFLERVGIMWVSGSIISAQEHFVSQIIRQKILVAIDGIKTQYHPQAKKFMLFLPNDEHHELSLLFLHYLLRANGFKVYYLGASVLLRDILIAAETIMPDVFYTILTTVPVGYSVENFLNTIALQFPESMIYLSGAQASNKIIGLQQNILVLPTIELILAKISELTADSV